MSGFMDDNLAEGALREKPKVAPRGRNRRAAAEEDHDSGAAPDPQAKPKQGGWGNDDGDGATAQAGRRKPAATDNQTAISGMNDDAKGKVDDDDGDTLFIPDLEEADEDDLTQVVAEPGMIDSGDLPTNLVVDDGQLPSAQVDGLDLSLLYEFLLPKKALTADDGSWDPDVMLNKVKQELQEESDESEALQSEIGNLKAQ